MTARLIVKKTLEEDGHEVIEAPDGAVARSVIEAHRSIGVIVSDRNMPTMNGSDCLKEIRKSPANQSMKVVICTTEAEKGRALAAVKGGANGYVLKAAML